MQKKLEEEFMPNNLSQNGKDPDATEQRATCPTCCTPIDDFWTCDPDHVKLDPCGHRLVHRRLYELLEEVALQHRIELQDASYGDRQTNPGGTKR